jgi:hypothetical protein
MSKASKLYKKYLHLLIFLSFFRWETSLKAAYHVVKANRFRKLNDLDRCDDEHQPLLRGSEKDHDIY